MRIIEYTAARLTFKRDEIEELDENVNEDEPVI